ncbi:MAG: YfhO family protein [Lachnospiraceae bacterium]|nr:YfhO family protein [Lachnospiraceae bacterium]
MLYAKHVIPFGTATILQDVSDDHPLMVFYRFQKSLHEGTFSLIAPAGVYDLTMLEAFPFYLSGPFTLLAALMPGRYAFIALSIFQILRTGLAGLSMCYLLKDRIKRTNPEETLACSNLICFLFSCAYALSSCFVVQEIDFRFADFAFLFPLLWMGYEALLREKKHALFLFTSIMMLLENAALALIILLLLLLHLICSDRREYKDRSIFRYIGYSFLSLMFSSVTVIPTLKTAFSHKAFWNSWPDFSFHMDWFSFFIRFMPDCDSSERFSDYYGINLYFTLFFFLLFILSFFSKNYSIRKRIGHLLFALILVFAINTNAGSHLFSITGFEQEQFCNFGFLLVFFGLLLSFDTISFLKDIPLPSFFIALFSALTLYFFASIHAKEGIAPHDNLPVLVFFVLYLILLILHRLGSVKKDPFLLICTVLIFTELLIQTEHLLYNLSEEQNTLSDQISYLDENLTFSDDPFLESGAAFQEPVSFDLRILPKSYLLPGYYKSVSRQLSDFETANAVYSSLGGKGKMFEVIDLPVSATPQSSAIKESCQPNNIYIFESSQHDSDYYEVQLNITPQKTAPLYYSIDNISYADDGKSGEPLSTSIYLPKMNYFSNIMQVTPAYFNKTGYEEMTKNIQNSQPKLHFTFESIIAQTDSSAESTLVLPVSASFPSVIRIDGQESVSSDAPAEKTGILLTPGAHRVEICCLTAGNLLPLFLSLLLCVLFLISKKNIPGFSYKKARVFLQNRCKEFYCIADHIAGFFAAHSTAILSFLIPSILLLISCVIGKFAPFGGSVYFKMDGAGLTLPNQYFLRSLMQAGNPDYSPISGGGMNAYYTNPSPFVNLWLYLFPEGSLIVPSTILSILFISLCGPCLYLYLTRRLTGRRVLKKDKRILIFTTAYALSAYNLNFRCFLNWPEIAGILPLLLLAMDYLIIKRKKALYVILLSYCMIINTMSAIYLCIFLFCWFFLYQFENKKDFFVKAVRFGLSSILSAGMALWILAVNVLARGSLGYNASDSILPDILCFYQSYFSSLKQTFLFAQPVVITEEDGAINLYCSVICLLLFCFFLLVAKKNKRYYGRLLIAAFLFVSSNNDMLSYFWNGLHYQSKVPNRYSFLLIFLLLDLSLEGLLSIRKASRVQIILVIVSALLFVVATTLAVGDPLSGLSVVCTALLIVIYGVLLFLSQYVKQGGKRICYTILAIIVLTELTVNNAYLFLQEDYGDGVYVDENIAVTDFAKQNKLIEDEQSRLTYLSNEFVNQNLVNNVPSANQFSSYTTSFQTSFASSYGYYDAPNHIANTTNETPFTNAMLNVGTMIVNSTVTSPYIDTAHYDVCGKYEDMFLLKNDRRLSLGFYLPASFSKIAENVEKTYDLANAFTKVYKTDHPIYSQILDLKLISKSDLKKQYQNSLPVNGCVVEEGHKDSMTPFHATIKVCVPENGEYYYRNSEFYYLGELKTDEEYEFTIPVRSDEEAGCLVRYDDDAFQAFYEKASKNMLHIKTYENDRFDGSINCPEDGYIMLSIPYEKGWKATLDGKDVNIDYYKNGAMMIAADKGEHELQMRFTAPGKRESILLTIPFWIIWVLLLLYENNILRFAKKASSSKQDMLNV